MVNTGHPSRACQGCRALKSKCDEGTPSCKRCERSGRQCIYAYTDPVFRSMNGWTAKNVRARVKSRLAVREAEDTQCMEKYLPSLPMLVSLEWSSHAIGPFFDRFVNQPDRYQSTWGFLLWLPKAYGDQSLAQYLTEATKACALANLANASKIPELEMLAARSYGSALKGLHKAMCKPETATSNDSLSTMTLLILYESIAGTKPPKELFHAHVQGQAAAMRLRAKHQTLSSVDSSVSSHTNRWLVWRDFADRNRPTNGLSHWPKNTYRSWLDELSASFSVQVADLCGQVRELQEYASAYGPLSCGEEFASCINDAVNLDQSFELQYASAPSNWLPTFASGRWKLRSALEDRVPANALSNLQCPILNWRLSKHDNVQTHCDFGEFDSADEPYFPRIDSYPSHAVALLWNYIRCARLHLLRVMIDLRLMVNKRHDTQHRDLPTIQILRSKISDTIHDICGSVASVLGEFYANLSDATQLPDMAAASPDCSGDAIMIMWMLHKVCAVPGISPQIRAWALVVFERIGTVGNIRQGMNLKTLYS